MNEIEKSLDLAIVQNTLPVKVEEAKQTPEEEIKSELDDLIELGKEALEDSMIIAKQTQDTKAFDSLAKMIKTVSDLHMKKYSIEKGKNYKSDGSVVDDTPTTVNNTTQQIFVGTTADLSNMLEAIKKNNDPK